MFMSLDGEWYLWMIAGFRALRGPHDSPRYRTLHRDLARAELAGEITEFQALIIQFILAASEDSDFSIDYLEMAAAVATSDRERVLVAGARDAHHRLHSRLPAAGAQLYSGPPGDGQPDGRWDRLLGALFRLGKEGDGVGSKLRGPRAA